MLPIAVDGYDDVVVRELEPPDEPAVQALFEACDDWFEAATGEPSMPGDVQGLYYSLPEAAELDAKRILVVCREGDVVGLVDAVLHHPDDASCAVGVFLLHPKQRRQRLGTSLARTFLALLAEHRIERVTASLAPGFQPGVGFVRSLGFAIEQVPPGSGQGNRNLGPHEPVHLRATLGQPR